MTEQYDGLILMNLGSPDSPEVKDVKKYLDEFLMDEKVIDYPYLLRLLLVRGIITPLRAPKSAEAYKSIWWKEGSPLIVLTKQLQQAVQQQTDIPVEIAMRYGNPSVEQAFTNIQEKNPNAKKVLALPLYPHYAMSSYETAVEHAKKIYKNKAYSFELEFVPAFYNKDEYIHALASSIKPYLNAPYDAILFSYHGIPERHLKKSDITKQHCLQVENCCQVNSDAHQYCYKHQCVETTKKVADVLQLPSQKVIVSFQSRLGREAWIKPYTAELLKELPKKGIKNLLVICPAFISDCLETLEEIKEEGKEIFLHAGGEQFTMIPCLNTNPEWVNTIKSWLN